MKSKNYVTFFGMLVLVCQLYAESNRFSMGINLGDLFSNYDLGSEMANTLYSQIQYPVLYMSLTESKIKIEPEFSYWRYSDDSNNGMYKSTMHYSVIHLGIGLSPIISQTHKTTTYIGAKIGLDKLYFENKSNYSYGSETSISSRTDLLIGPYLGIEYMLRDKLSLGTEFQIMTTILGNEDNTGSSNAENYDNKSGYFINSEALLFLKWHF